jgi:hypothetical protein
VRPVLRTCVGCRRKEDRSVFLRIGRADGVAVALWAGAGRSAYLHQDMDCIDKALRKGCLERALRGPVSAQEREVLRELLVCQLR